MDNLIGIRKAQIFSLLLFICATAIAQDSTQKFKTAGAIVGYGHQINIETRYNPIFFAGDFSWQFGKERKKNFLALYLEPQFNLVATVRPLDIEFGSNIGLRYYEQLSPGLYLYQMLGSGPHYITADLPRQAKGFIFSDNLAFGLFRQLNKNKPLFLNLDRKSVV